MNALAFPGFTPDPGLAADIQLRVLSLGVARHRTAYPQGGSGDQS